ncbi:MAG: AEC family transporter [Butyrivibrio sp.]|nr:AEC family transporter [Butyrivibrio sp.]
MELSILLCRQIMIQFLMMIVGVILKRIRLISEEGTKALSKLVFFVIMPCAVFHSFQIEKTGNTLVFFLLTTGFSVCINLLFFIITLLGKKLLALDGIDQATLLYPNCSNLIIPLVGGVLGPEWELFCCPYIMIQQLFFFSYGINLIREKKKHSLKDIFLNVNMIAIFLGILSFITSWEIPSFIGETIGYFAGMIAPASMLVIGLSIGSVDVKTSFFDAGKLWVCFIRLIIMPLSAILLIKATGICSRYDGMKQVLFVLVLQAASSSAAMIAQTASVYGKDSRKASILNMMTVIFLIITMPVNAYIYETLL